MNKLRTLIVDDEALARRVLVDYVEKLDRLSLLGECPDGLSALSILREGKVDLMLLDINMPELSGLELLESLPDPPLVIFTTAYSEFALKSYDFGVVDYLLKPISFARFLRAVNRVPGVASPTMPVPAAAPSTSFSFRHDGLPMQLPLVELRYVKSFGNYLRLVTAEKTYTILGTLTKMEKSLPPAFLRVHKSYIVNTELVEGLRGNTLDVAGAEVPLSPLYRRELEGILGR